MRPLKTQDHEIDVLHVIGSLSAGGAERNLYYLAPHFASSRVRYGVCCLFRKGEFAEEVENLGVPVFELGYRKRFFLSTVLRLARLLRSYKVKVIHTHLFQSGLVGRLAAWRAGVPAIIVHEHGKTLWKRWYHRIFERYAIGRTDLRLAVSKDIMDLRLRHEHTPASKIRIVFNAVDPARFDSDEATRVRKRIELGLDNSFIIGTIGRLVDAKSYDFLLEATARISKQRPDLSVIVVGEGELLDDLKRLRDSLDLARTVHFLGKRTDIPDLMAAMDLYVISSKREGLPVTLIEAMMAGKPIISTAVGGIPDAISHGVDGLLVKPGDEEGFGRTILDLAGNAAEMDRLGRNARKKAIARYSPGTVLRQLEEIYEEMLSGKGGHLLEPDGEGRR
jgi:glycosyltransferase involved in cell wall biosynthesis